MEEDPAAPKMENSNIVVVRDGTSAEQQLYLLDTGIMTDCTFVVGTDDTEKLTFHCHKLMLSKCSQVFYAMFNGSLIERGDIVVDDIVPSNFRKMLEYIYADTVDLEDVEIALGVCYAAHKYLITYLQNKCVTFIMENLAARNVCQALELSRLINNQQLENFCIEFIQYNTEDVLASESFQQTDLNTLVTILKLNEMNVDSELPLFFACVRWANAHWHPEQQDNHRLVDVLGTALSYIRFRTLTSDDFATHVCSYGILTIAEENAIFRCLTINTAPMPEGFSNETCGRVPYYRTKLECLVFNLTPLVGRTWRGNPIQKFSLTFSLNTTIVINGILMHGWRQNAPAPYDEKFAIVLKRENDVVANMRYEGQVFYRSVFNVHFSESVLIAAGIYELSIIYANDEFYDLTHFSDAEFKLSSGVTLSNVSGNTQVCGIMHIRRK